MHGRRLATISAMSSNGLSIQAISSMATRQVLAELAADYALQHGVAVANESVGGVDAARRVMGGEDFDLVVLSSEAIDKLFDAGRLLGGSRVELMRSEIAVAVPAGAPLRDISTESALRAAVLQAPKLAFSTGPSGVYITQLFERWGLAQELQPRLVQAPAGVPVASLLASGRVSLGFQQLSELQSAPGVKVVGTLPKGIAFVTTFAAGVGLHCQQPDVVAAWLQYLLSPDAAPVMLRHGLASAAPSFS